MSVTHTGHPGPMITFSAFGRMVRRPYLAIDCSWLPHTCMTETGSRPISRHTCSSARASPRAFSGSRNLSSRAPTARVSSIGTVLPGRRDLPPHVGRHHVALRLLEQQLVQGERLLDLGGLDPLVHDVEPRLAAHPPEIHGGGLSVHLHDSPRHA